MKYEMGDKVETPLGVGVIFAIQDKILEEDTNEHYYKVEFPKTKINFLATFTEDEVKPYKTPNEKLIELEYRVIQCERMKIYRHDNLSDIRVFDDNTISCNEIDLELAKIIKEYLEWLEEENERD